MLYCIRCFPPCGSTIVLHNILHAHPKCNFCVVNEICISYLREHALFAIVQIYSHVLYEIYGEMSSILSWYAKILSLSMFNQSQESSNEESKSYVKLG